MKEREGWGKATALQSKDGSQDHQGALEPKSTIREALVSQEGPALVSPPGSKIGWEQTVWDMRHQDAHHEGFQSLELKPFFAYTPCS